MFKVVKILNDYDVTSIKNIGGISITRTSSDWIHDKTLLHFDVNKLPSDDEIIKQVQKIESNSYHEVMNIQITDRTSKKGFSHLDNKEKLFLIVKIEYDYKFYDYEIHNLSEEDLKRILEIENMMFCKGNGDFYSLFLYTE